MKRIAIFVVVLAAGCSQAQWSRKDTATDQAHTDLRECEDAAYREANAVAHPYPTMGPVILQDASGQRFNVYPTGPFADPHGERFMRQARLARQCMSKRGYELVPAEPKKS